MLDVLTALVFDEPVDHYAATGIPVRTGNADARGAPINSYRCADGWVAVTCTSEGQFARAVRADGSARTARAVPRRPCPRPRRARPGPSDRSVDRDTSRTRGRGRTRRHRVPGRPRARSDRGRARPCGRGARAAGGAPPPRRARRPPERVPRRPAPDRVRRAGSTCRRPSRSARAPTPCCATSPAATTPRSPACAPQVWSHDGMNMTTPLLDGMRVLDAGIWRPVPHATQMLADLGAAVCKLEPPGGDPMRAFPQLFRDIASHKRSVVVDLRTDAGRARALALAAEHDVFCEGWRPGRRRPARGRLRRDPRRQPRGDLLLDLGVRADRSARRPTRPRPQLPGARGRGCRPTGRRDRPRHPARADRGPRRGQRRRAPHLRGVGEAAADR